MWKCCYTVPSYRHNRTLGSLPMFLICPKLRGTTPGFSWTVRPMIGWIIHLYFKYHNIPKLLKRIFLAVFYCQFCICILITNKFLFAEFATQLPHDGGAFYSTDTMESCRQHYAAMWPPLLHAAVLWLNHTGFHIENDNETTINRFHLLFGTVRIFS